MQYGCSILGLLLILLVIHLIFINKKKKDLALSENINRQLIEALPYGVFITDLERKVIFVNAAGISMLGATTSNQVVGRQVRDFIHPSYMDLENSLRFDSCKEGVSLEEVAILGVDGNRVDIELTTMPFLYNSKKSILAIARDINIEKQAGELKREAEENSKKLRETLDIDKLKTDFFANISHELRTPLNIIFSTLQLFDLHIKNDEAAFSESKIKKYMSVMRQNCYRLLRLVNNLIDSTKIDSGYFEMQLQSCNIVNVVEEITMSAADYIKNKGIDLMFDTDTEEKFVECDPDKIERIILNLLSNAVKFTKPGGVIAVTIHDIDESVMITVKDTGIGIPSDKLDVIFERFRQVNKSLTRGNQGSGIGLSLVKSLVEMHNGTISVCSEYGNGSEFVIKLPAKNRNYECDKLRDKNIFENNNIESHIERINLEFSDIYLKE